MSHYLNLFGCSLFMVITASVGFFMYKFVGALFAFSQNNQRATGLTVLYGDFAESSLLAGALLLILGFVLVKVIPKVIRASIG